MATTFTCNNSTFRLATANDTARCWQILQQGKAQMMREGKHQWTEAYPSLQSVERDIAAGNAYVIERQGSVIAYGAVIANGEPAYEQIAHLWLTNADYVVVHRLAVADEAKRQGVAAQFFNFASQWALQRNIHSFKVDTNYDNFYMQRLLRSQGFMYCGDVHYPQGDRMAYEKLL
ncbi:MAG: GNAT family N-acetyltransferase [Muribaculaceae bacterium]